MTLPERSDKQNENDKRVRRKDNKRVGAQGELLVRQYLERDGWHVLTANFRCPQGEIDLIAEQPAMLENEQPTLVFVEVKTRRGTTHGLPLQAVDGRKQEKLRLCALAYLGERDAAGAEPACRFDVAEVFIDGSGLARIVMHTGIF